MFGCTRMLRMCSLRRVIVVTATALVVLIATLRSDVAFGQGHIVVEQDVIYGQAAGSALMADVAYPVSEDLVPAIIYVHGGRWRAGERTGRDRLDVYEWAAKGFFAMTIDYRLVPASPASHDDRSVPVQQAHDMVAAMETANAPYQFVHYTDRGHMRVTDEVITETLAFIADLEGS